MGVIATMIPNERPFHFQEEWGPITLSYYGETIFHEELRDPRGSGHRDERLTVEKTVQATSWNGTDTGEVP